MNRASSGVTFLAVIGVALLALVDATRARLPATRLAFAFFVVGLVLAFALPLALVLALAGVLVLVFLRAPARVPVFFFRLPAMARPLVAPCC
jgi:hypothetical protein